VIFLKVSMLRRENEGEMVKFIHTADWQIGKPFAGIGDAHKRALVQQERIEAIKRIGRVAQENGAAFVLVAGDLFDSPSADNRKAQAIALIDNLFQQEQRALADRFSQPLAEKIGDYLKRLFGPEARAVVTFEDNAFKSIELVRSTQGGALPFDSLSGGTREQVAAAVRLAIAELLAADHDGSLPIVFDDAFAYSDPDRVSTMQGMLDLGASRGLQVIVLSCNPSDYAGLGTSSVTLSI